MGDILLPGPETSYPLPLTLQLVKDLESAGGSLFKTADMLLAQELPQDDMIKLLAVIYRHAGCAMESALLDDFLLRSSPATTLTGVLVGLLAPLHDLGAVAEA